MYRMPKYRNHLCINRYSVFSVDAASRELCDLGKQRAGCSVPSVARALPRARGFLNCIVLTILDYGREKVSLLQLARE